MARASLEDPPAISERIPGFPLLLVTVPYGAEWEWIQMRARPDARQKRCGNCSSVCHAPALQAMASPVGRKSAR